MPTPVGIVGFRGYSGAELIRILHRHLHTEPILLEHRTDSGEDTAPRGARKPRKLSSSAESVKAEGLAVVFLATPPEVSMELTPALLDAGAKVVDLSGAFRLRTPEHYKRWYKSDHTAPALLAEAAYGLPEFFRDQIKPARLVSNPGCYPTAANLAIRPLLDAGILDRAAGIVCDFVCGRVDAVTIDAKPGGIDGIYRDLGRGQRIHCRANLVFNVD